MERTDKVNLLYKLSESLCFIASNIVVLGVLSRHLTEDELGTFSLISSFVYFFTTLTFGEAMTKICTRDLLQGTSKHSTSCFANSIYLVTSFSIILLIFCYFFKIGGYFLQDYSILFYTLVFVALGNILRQSESSLNHKGKLRWISLGHIFTDILRAIIVPLVIYFAATFKTVTLTNYCVLYLCSNLLFLFISLKTIKRYEWKPSLEVLKHLFIQALPLALMILAARLYVRIDVLMIEAMLGKEQVAHYAVAYSILDNLMIISNILMDAIFPGFSKFIFTDSTAFKRLYHGIIRIFIKYLFPLAILIAIFSKQILGFLYGLNYADNFVTMLFLMVAAMIAFINGPSGSIFIALGKQKIYMYGTILSFVMNVVLNLILLPIMGGDGAALATALTELTICSWSLWFIYKNIGLLPWGK